MALKKTERWLEYRKQHLMGWPPTFGDHEAMLPQKSEAGEERQVTTGPSYHLIKILFLMKIPR